MERPSNPVWVTGRITKETSRDITLRAVDTRNKTRDVVLPKVHLTGTCEAAEQLLVPQWWAHQNKLPYQQPRKDLPRMRVERSPEGDVSKIFIDLPDNNVGGGGVSKPANTEKHNES